MKKIKYTLIFLFLIVFISKAFAQNEKKEVTIITSGNAKNVDDAKQAALRSAIEQTFGAFISTKTEILNDKLIKDEIISVASGNIKSYEVLSQSK